MAQTEETHPSGNCSYCLTKRVYLVSLPCQHSFCGNCCLNIVKLTKIKKGLSHLHGQRKEEGEPSKCPKCAIVHMVTDEDKKMYEDVLGVQEIKERL